MFSFYYEARTAPFYIEQKAIVRRVFELIRAGVYEPFTSLYTTREINNEPDKDKREKMKALISDCGVVVLPVTEEIERLAVLYIQEKAITSAWITDAAHIATATHNGMDFIVSLNFTHIVRPWTIEKVRSVNMREKYQAIGIYKPVEVLEIYEDSARISE
jgi:predicted nucleic acid-binding protein